MEITIYGSYNPPDQKNLLIRMKNALVLEGYSSAKIVEERPNPTNLDEFEISKACLEFSDVNFLIFTFAGKRFGVIRELAYCAGSTAMTDRRWRCVLCAETKGKRSALPTLSGRELEKLHVSKILLIPFRDEVQLKNALIGTAWKYLCDLAEELRNRSSHI